MEEGRLMFPRKSAKKTVGEIGEVLKVQEGMIKSKLVEIKDSISSIIADDNVEHLLEAPEFAPDYFSPSNPKTKEAEEFVRQINLRREQQRQREREVRRKEEQAKLKRQEEAEKEKKENMSERHLKIKERHEMRR